MARNKMFNYIREDRIWCDPTHSDDRNFLGSVLHMLTEGSLQLILKLGAPTIQLKPIDKNLDYLEIHTLTHGLENAFKLYHKYPLRTYPDTRWCSSNDKETLEKIIQEAKEALWAGYGFLTAAMTALDECFRVRKEPPEWLQDWAKIETQHVKEHRLKRKHLYTALQEYKKKTDYYKLRVSIFYSQPYGVDRE